MVLSPVSTPDWVDPAWDIATPDPESNILTSSRLKNERGRGCHKVEESSLRRFFVSTVEDVVSKLSDTEKQKINMQSITSTCELQTVYVTINQCTVRRPFADVVLRCAG